MPKVNYVGDMPPPVAERPRCVGCGEPRKPYYQHDWDTFYMETREKFWDGEYQGYGHFCTMRCATRFANKVVEDAQS